MSSKLPLPRYSIEQSDNHVRVTIPGKKNFFKILWYCLWLILWGYITGSMIFILGTMVTGVFFLGNDAPGSTSTLLITIICTLPYLFALLGLGGMGLYSLGWQLMGKEIIEANAETLSITKQIFRWKQAKTYAAQTLRDLRVNTQGQLSAFIPILKSFRKLFGYQDLIAFDYNAKTVRFGAEIDEAEAKQIIEVLLKQLPQQNTGA